MPDLLIIGTGAMACLVAAKFSKTDSSVDLFGSFTASVQALRESGVELTGTDGERRNFPIHEVITDPSKLKNYPVILFLNKSYQLDGVLSRISIWGGEVSALDSWIMTLQNGIGNREKIQACFPNQPVFAGTTTYAARQIGPGAIVQTGEGQIALPSVEANGFLGHRFSQAGFMVTGVADIDSLLWGKLVINSAINPLTALHGVRNGDLIRNPNLRIQMTNIALESARVAGTMGIVLPYDDPIEEVEKVCLATADNYSSMAQDIARGSQTEIDAINGQVAASALKLGVAAPLNTALFQAIKSLESQKKEG